MHFTKSQIEEIGQRLAIQTKKDSEFEDAEIPLDGSERLPVIQYIPLVQDWENRLLSFADMRRMVLSNTDMELVGCVLTVTCNVQGASIVIKNNREQVAISSGAEYHSFYGEVNTVTVAADGYDTWYESVTMTQDHSLVVNLNEIASPWQDAFDQLQAQIDGITLTDNGDYYTLTIKGKTVKIYSKDQVDALIAGGGSGGGGGTPDSDEDAYLNFSESSVAIPADGSTVNLISVNSNISWAITAVAMPEEQQDEQTPQASTAVNIYPETISGAPGDSVQLQIK